MNELFLLTDGSVNVETRVGYGAYLLVHAEELFNATLKSKVKTKCFENTSSTKLELQTLLWALSELQESSKKLIIYTDSQNIAGLPGRRKRVEKNNYFTKKNELIANHELYKTFFQCIDFFESEIVKVKGHQPGKNKNEIERFFTLVDRASRNALRKGN